MKNIPVINVQRNSLAFAYHCAIRELYDEGIRFKTQYDKPGDPESIDATANITILSPWTDPMIHKAFPGGIEDLREYVMELRGYKDHWVKNMNNPDDTRWEYTYHQRFADWGTWFIRDMNGKRIKVNYTEDSGVGVDGVNQIGIVINKLIEQPFTRQAQMITWMPFMDTDIYDPPCLQSIWYRILEDDGIWYLNSNVRIRSNDAWGASFMNMFGITLFNKIEIADVIAERTGKEVKLGRMNWQADSFHIYGKDIKDVKNRLIDRKRSIDDLTYNFHDPDIQEIYNEAESTVIDKIEKYDKEHNE